MRVYIDSYGCSANHSNAEIMAGLLAEAGFCIADEPYSADVIVVNTCTVKTPTERKILRRLRELSGRNLVVTGCMADAQRQTIAKTVPQATILPSGNTQGIVGAVRSQIAGYTFEGKFSRGQDSCLTEDSAAGSRPELKVDLPKLRRNPVINIVQINEGCLSNCTYCITKQAKGNLRSYPANAILADVRKGIEDGCKEVWLTSQDTGAYGLDIGTNLAALLRKVCALHGDFRVRAGMTNPQHISPFLPELVLAYRHPKMFRFLHMPVQAGSDKVLKDMGRGYTVQTFLRIIEAFRLSVPDVTISTDFICGFPTETEEDFEQSLDLVKAARFGIVNVSRFWARPRTSAATLPRFHGQVTKERSTRLVRLWQGLAQQDNTLLVGSSQRILLDEQGKGGVIGRTDTYKQVFFRCLMPLGSWIDARIEKATAFDLRGVIDGAAEGAPSQRVSLPVLT
ncbi:hypothetical protein AUJ68_04255 [Candidatus Woesearchaeota archaeon CG1_02_57_44]|nr:MAG: hypothetical protein AUJ68_04255 [Candidatus Woesearchaeota archaeon CG1_02_57_44]PIN69013.1 MAG: threonylcarbamoyladenosine tRNA methylthiotransferase [Candidatus Woesearchaeota archaeon CG11_big_fil_rev_8_21_14_0_20_57_5]